MARYRTMMEIRSELDLNAAKQKRKRAEERAATTARIAANVDETNALIAEVEAPLAPAKVRSGKKVADGDATP